MNTLLGIDLGTSSVKALLMDERGQELGFGAQGYGIEKLRPEYAEQSPERWWTAAAGAVARALAASGVRPEEVAGIGLSGQMHGLVALDSRGRPVRPAVIWADQRTEDQVRLIDERIGRSRFGAVTGNRPAAGFFLPSLLWIKEHEPDAYARTATALLPKDYLRLRLTGRAGTDWSDASATLAFDVQRRVWAVDLLEELGLDPGVLPECGAPREPCGGVGRDAARAAGLAPGTPVFLGGGDQPMQALGCGVIGEGAVSLNIGTGAQISTPLGTPKRDPQLRTNTFCHVPEHTWYVMGATLNGGLALKWLAERVLEEESYPRLDAEAGAVSPGSGGLVFLPYLVGERTPHFDPGATAMFCGLNLGHGRGHMIRAVMEGVVFALRDSLEIIRTLGVEVESAIAAGGGATSPLWLQIQADVLNLPIRVTAIREQACVGAAITAGVGAGVFSTYTEACERISKLREGGVDPRPAAVRRYDDVYGVYRDLYHRNPRGGGSRGVTEGGVT